MNLFALLDAVAVVFLFGLRLAGLGFFSRHVAGIVVEFPLRLLAGLFCVGILVVGHQKPPLFTERTARRKGSSGNRMAAARNLTCLRRPCKSRCAGRAG